MSSLLGFRWLLDELVRNISRKLFYNFFSHGMTFSQRTNYNLLLKSIHIKINVALHAITSDFCISKKEIDIVSNSWNSMLVTFIVAGNVSNAY